MERSTRNRFGLASFVLAAVTMPAIMMPLCGCGDPNGMKDNPYAAPNDSADVGSETTTTTTEPPAVESAEESSAATE